LAATIATLGLAWLSYRVIERPGIALGRRLEPHLAASA
jgi:peptidoglycan/LPS O-acetylase OafA/YrhL